MEYDFDFLVVKRGESDISIRQKAKRNAWFRGIDYVSQLLLARLEL